MTPSVLPKFSIRQASPADLSLIMAWEYLGFHQDIQESQEVFADRLDVFPQGALILNDTKPCGYLMSELWDPVDNWVDWPFTLNHGIRTSHNPLGTVLYISSMTIEPRLRGQGAGAWFFEAALDHLVFSLPHLREVVLMVHEDWKSAQAIYKAKGFSQLGVLEGIFPVPRGGGAGLVMKKALAGTR